MPKAKRKPAKKAARKPAKKPARKATASASSGKHQFLDTFSREHMTTLKVLRALPPGQGEFRPHERSKTARDLAWTFVVEQYLLMKALNGEPMFAGGGPPPAPSDFQTVVSRFEGDHAAIVDRIKTTPDSWFSETVQFMTGPGTFGDWKKGDFAWFILSDQIHHRGQFSVYVRMAGGKVPSIYGPSADEPWR